MSVGFTWMTTTYLQSTKQFILGRRKENYFNDTVQLDCHWVSKILNTVKWV